MKRRTFLASLIGLCLAPLAKVKAVVKNVPNVIVTSAVEFGRVGGGHSGRQWFDCNGWRTEKTFYNGKLISTVRRQMKKI